MQAVSALFQGLVNPQRSVHVEQVATDKSVSILGFERVTEALYNSLTIVGTIRGYDLLPDNPTYLPVEQDQLGVHRLSHIET